MKIILTLELESFDEKLINSFMDNANRAMQGKNPIPFMHLIPKGLRTAEVFTKEIASEDILGDQNRMKTGMDTRELKVTAVCPVPIEMDNYGQSIFKAIKGQAEPPKPANKIKLPSGIEVDLNTIQPEELEEAFRHEFQKEKNRADTMQQNFLKAKKEADYLANELQANAPFPHNGSVYTGGRQMGRTNHHHIRQLEEEIDYLRRELGIKQAPNFMIEPTIQKGLKKIDFGKFLNDKDGIL